MGATNNLAFVGLVNKTFCCDNASEENIAQRAVGLLRTAEVYLKPAADGAANSTQALFPGLRIDNNIEITSCQLVPYGALTADNTNNAVVSLQANDGAGGAATTVATVTTNVAAGNWVAGTRFALTLTATLADRIVSGLAAERWLGMTITKGGTGVVVPSCKLVIQYRLV